MIWCALKAFYQTYTWRHFLTAFCLVFDRNVNTAGVSSRNYLGDFIISNASNTHIRFSNHLVYLKACLKGNNPFKTVFLFVKIVNLKVFARKKELMVLIWLGTATFFSNQNHSSNHNSSAAADTCNVWVIQIKLFEPESEIKWEEAKFYKITSFQYS